MSLPVLDLVRSFFESGKDGLSQTFLHAHL
jgi:hypothetical protein